MWKITGVGLLAALMLAGCQPAPAAAPVTPHLEDGAAIMADGARLPLRTWLAADPRAVIVAVHGHNDYSRTWEYFGPAPWFAERNISVYGYDQRGYGQAPGRGYWAGGDRMAEDLATVVRLVHAANPKTPVYILGASMGGAVTLRAMALPDGPHVDGIILAAPALLSWRSTNFALRTGLRLKAFFTPDAKRTRADVKEVNTENAPLRQIRANDPLVLSETRYGNLPGILDLATSAVAAAPNIRVPVLYLYGGHDQSVPKRQTAQVVASMRKGGVPIVVACYPEGWHMIVQGLNREQVWTDIQSWLFGRNVPLPSGAERDLKACGL